MPMRQAEMNRLRRVAHLRERIGLLCPHRHRHATLTVRRAASRKELVAGQNEHGIEGSLSFPLLHASLHDLLDLFHLVRLPQCDEGQNGSEEFLASVLMRSKSFPLNSL